MPIEPVSPWWAGEVHVSPREQLAARGAVLSSRPAGAVVSVPSGHLVPRTGPQGLVSESQGKISGGCVALSGQGHMGVAEDGWERH